MATPPLQNDKNIVATGATDRESSDFEKRLSDEYKILQDKIDKIGGFRFTVKGWSLTAVIAAAAAVNGKSLTTVFIISLGLVLMLIFFFRLEYEQVQWSRLFGKRAGQIEDAFRKIDHGSSAEMLRSFPVPYTAHELVLAGYRRRLGRRSRRSAQRSDTRATWNERWYACKQAHILFYVILIILALALLLPQYAAIAVFSAKVKGAALALVRRVL